MRRNISQNNKLPSQTRKELQPFFLKKIKGEKSHENELL